MSLYVESLELPSRTICLSPLLVKAQVPVDTTNAPDIDTTGQKDLIDIGLKLFKFKPRKYPNKEKKQIYYYVIFMKIK